jgi:sugar (pentulose or hexulose) kinase
VREKTLVFDLGTSYFKAALVDVGNQVGAIYRAVSPIVHPSFDRSEIDLEAFKSSIRNAVLWLRAHTPGGLSDVGLVTFSTQANTFMLLDNQDQPLTPLIVWNDARAKELTPLVMEWASDPTYSASTGIPMLDHQFAICKLRWLARDLSRDWSRGYRIRFLGDCLTHWLTGVEATDGSIAALSGLFDLPRWQWSPTFCEQSGIDAAWLPRVLPSGTVVGTVSDKIASELGLPRECRFAVGGLDQYACAIGLGNSVPGRTSETTGTVLCTIQCAKTFDRPSADQVFRGPGPSGLFYHMLFGNVSANLLEYYRSILPDHPDFESLDRAAEEAYGREAIAPLEYHCSLETVLAAVRQLVTDEPRGRAVLCIYQTVACALAAQLTALTGVTRPDVLLCGGRGARSKIWLRVKADLLGVKIIPPSSEEPGLIGASMQATGHRANMPG